MDQCLHVHGTCMGWGACYIIGMSQTMSTYPLIAFPGHSKQPLIIPKLN